MNIEPNEFEQPASGISSRIPRNRNITPTKINVRGILGDLADLNFPSLQGDFLTSLQTEPLARFDFYTSIPVTPTPGRRNLSDSEIDQ